MITNTPEVRVNEAGKRIPTSSDSRPFILHYLMGYCVNIEDKHYHRRAVDTLLKRLQDDKEEIDELIEAVTSYGNQPTKCITLPRTLDGRFQIAARKGFPHVVYARTFRWPDIQKCQIVHIPTCNFGYDLELDHICVNPYHYKKITSLEDYTMSIALSIENSDLNKTNNNIESHENETCIQNIADNDGGKKQGMSQQQQNQATHQLNEEKLIPIVVEQQSSASKYIEPPQPRVKTPAVSLSMCEQVLLDQSDFQNRTLSNNQSQNNFKQIVNLSATGITLIVNNPPLLSNCIQQSQDFVRGKVESVYISEMPPPSKTPLSSNSIFANNNQQPQDVQSNSQLKKISDLPPPSSTPLPNNSPIYPHDLFDFQPSKRQHNKQLIKCSHELQNKDTSLNNTFDLILAENNRQETASNNSMDENTLNETLNKNLQNENSLSSNTEPTKIQSNIEKALNNNSNYKDITEQNGNQQLQPISNVSHLTQNIEAISSISDIAPLSPISAIIPPSPISVITPLSPISTIAPLSPISAIQPLSPEQFQCENTTLLLLDGEEENKDSINKEQLQNDKSGFLNEKLHDSMTQNNNTRQSTSQYFSDSMISFINNNVMEQSQMSSVSKCERYLLNHSNEKNALPYMQSLTNNNGNTDPHTCNEANNLQSFQNNYIQNNTQQVHNQVQSHDKVRNNMNEFFNMPNMLFRNTRSTISFNNPPLEHWCSINYFEMDSQVGETFKVKNEHTTVVVDGYFDPDSENRFCLGRLTNVSRSEQSERTRMHIAQGIALELHENGDIWLRCKSKSSVFIQGDFMEMRPVRTTRDTVHKIASGNYKKVFDLQRCYKHIKAQIASAQAAFKAQLITKGHPMGSNPGRPSSNFLGPQGLEAIGMSIDDLRCLCILRISFVKGWGVDYPRLTIKETPCWIEVHVHRALQILDEFLLLDKIIVRGMD